MDVPTSVSQDWVTTEKGNAHQAIISLIYRLDADNTPRENNMIKNMKMYSNTYYTNVVSAFNMYNDTRPDIFEDNVSNRIVWNICKSSCDTIAAKISKNKVKATVVTDEGDFYTQRKAKKMDEAIYAIMLERKYGEAAKQQFLDALICGTGIIEVSIKDEEVCYSRVLPMELYVDELDAIYGDPKRLYRSRIVSKSKLKKQYPKLADKIDGAASIRISTSNVVTADATILYEAWQIGNKKEPGRYVSCVDTCTLVDEEYKELDFPFIILRWSKPSLGFWGVGLIDELAPFQLEINKILFFIQKAMQLGHAPKWFMNSGSIPKGYLSNKIGTIVPFTGVNPPHYYAPEPIHQQVIDYVQMLKNEAFAMAGISQLSAQSIKPAGLDSGVALQTYNDIESERFVLAGQAFEDSFVEAFKKTIIVLKILAKDNPELSIMNFGNKNAKIKWLDIDLNQDRFTIKVFPTSALPNHPEGRLQRLNDFMNLGIISPEDFIQLLDMPDIAEFNKLTYSGISAAKDNIERIMDGEEYVPPEQYDDLPQSLKVAIQAYLNLRTTNTDEVILQNVRSYIDELRVLIDATAPQTQETIVSTPTPDAPMPGAPVVPPQV